MTKQDVPTLAVKTGTTLFFLLSVGVLVLVNREVFDCVGWLEPTTICLLGGGGILFVGSVASRSQRKLLVPSGAIVALAAVLVAATWAYPSTPRTQFFADAAQVEVGMTSHDISVRLNKYPLFTGQSPDVIYDPSATPINRDAIPIHYNGYLVATTDEKSGDTASFEMENGKVINIYHRSNWLD